MGLGWTDIWVGYDAFFVASHQDLLDLLDEQD